MTTPQPPGPDEPVLDPLAVEPHAPVPDASAAEQEPAAPASGEPVLDSFAAEEPAEPAGAAPDATAPAVLPGSDLPGTLGSPPAPEPGSSSTGPHGSEGLTTAPPSPPAPVTEPATTEPVVADAVPAVERAAVEPVTADAVQADAVQAEEIQAEPTGTGPTETEPALAAGYPLPAAHSQEPADHLNSGAPPVEAASGPGRSRAWLPLTAVGLAVALLAGGTGWLAWQLRQQDRSDTASVDAVAAARDAARLLFSYDHKTLQADFDKGLAVTTGDFRAQYQRTTKDVVSPVAEQYKAVVKAEVVEAAVIDARADEVTALVFLNQATTSTRVQGQQVDQSRVRMRLVPRGGRWLVEEVKAL